MTDIEEKLINLLTNIFQFENEDLDFGIYKILNFKKKEISNFIEKDLVQEINTKINEISQKEKNQLNIELDLVKSQIKKSGNKEFEQDSTYKSIKKEIEAINTTELEKEIYNHIYTFFSRYYDKGDFISKRRYGKNNRYVIPYNGEEILLHWANNDQYYIKTNEFLKKYTFRIPNLKVNFRLIGAQEDKENITSEEKKFFIIFKKKVYVFKNHDLTIYFEYRGLNSEEKRKFSRHNQEKINEDNWNTIEDNFRKEEKFKKIITPDVNGKTILGYHLAQYTGRNTSDYFIHKDLNEFLIRELDFYIKNEVINLSDIKIDKGQINNYFVKIGVLLSICTKIINFLAQIEDFQLKIWEKKKFVLSTDYIISLDNIPEKFHEEILNNNIQIKEWKKLYSQEINSINDLIEERTLEGINFKKLPVDTNNFNSNFKYRLIEEITKTFNLDNVLNGTIIKSENFQGLNLVLKKYRNKVKLIYIDPPFNTGNDDFLYKDNYMHSSWQTMMYNRLILAKEFLKDDGIIAVHIDDIEQSYLKIIMDNIFGRENFVTNLSIKSSTPSGLKTAHKNKTIIKLKDHILIYKKKDIKVNPIYIKKDTWDSHYNQIFIKDNFEIKNLKDELIAEELLNKKEKLSELNIDSKNVIKYYIKNKDSIFQTQPEMPKDIKKLSKENVNQVIEYGEKDDKQYAYNGRRLAFLSNVLNPLENGQLDLSNLLCDIWYDLDFQNTQNEGGTSFPSGKKPERLIFRLIKLFTNENDLILDFFLGSGTTCSVANKLNRKSIGIEFTDYGENDSLVRIKNVIFGENSGISKLIDWKGGGFFKYHHLEQYEDSLENIEFSQTALDEFKDYFIHYMLDFETRKSQNLLNIDKMHNPFDYKINVLTDDQLKSVNVDLIETYNYLIGIKVRKLKNLNNVNRNKVYLIIEGQKGDKNVLVIWRDLNELDPDDDLKFIERNVLLSDFDEVHLNGNSLVQDAILIEKNFRSIMNGR